MYEMRRKDRQIPNEEAIALLKQQQYGVLSTMGRDGYPYGVPLSFVYEDPGLITFHCAVEGHKIDNLAYCSKACFTVVGPTEPLPEQFSTRYISAICFGTLRELTGEEKVQGLLKFGTKYAPQFLEKGAKYTQAAKDRTRVYEMQVEQLTGKARR